METADIRKYFSVNLSSDRTLTAQLEEGIARFIAEHEDGTLLPPELVLAETLGISRVTVRNALKPFLEKGQIVREVRKGTRICKSDVPQDSSFSLSRLALGIEWPVIPKKVLRFLSYEMIPFQRQFWERVVREYSRKNPEVQVQLVPMEKDMPSRNISELLQEKRIDLFLFSFSYSEPLAELAQPLSADLRNYATGREYLSSADCFRERPYYHYLLPVNLTTSVIGWNVELAAGIGLKDIRCRLEQGKFLELIKEAAPLLPEGCFASGHAWDLIFAGYPVAGSEMDQLKKRLFQIEDILKTPRACITSATHTLEDFVRKLREGRILFFLTTMATFFARGEPAFPFALFPVAPAPGCLNMIRTLNIAISKFSEKVAESEKFMRFLLSPQVQKWIASVKRAAPIRKEDFHDFMDREFQYTPEQAEKWLHYHKIFESPFAREENYNRFTIYECRKELENIAAGRCSVEKAVSLLRAKYNRQLKILEENL